MQSSEKVDTDHIERNDGPSACAKEVEELVANAYRTVLLREPDANGLEVYTSYVSNGARPHDLYRELIRSEEFGRASLRHPSVAESVARLLLRVLSNTDPTEQQIKLHAKMVMSGQIAKNRSISSDPSNVQAIDVRQILLVHETCLFDELYYSQCAGIAFPDRASAVQHFVQQNEKNIADPHWLFSTRFYCSRFGEAEIGNPLVHFLTARREELVSPHPLFDLEWYTTTNALDATTNPLVHYASVGWQEGCRVHPLFDHRWYRDQNPDVASEFADVFEHFIRHGHREGRSPSRFFDTNWYLSAYPDVAVAGENALAHYLREGLEEGRNPSAHFSTSWYQEFYSDVAAAGHHPLIHFAEHGASEGRRPAPEVRMSSSFGLTPDDFQFWRGQVFSRHLNRHHVDRRETSLKLKEMSGPELLVMVTQDSPDKIDHLFTATKDSFVSAADSVGVRVTVVGRPELCSFRGFLTENTIVIVVHSGDVIDYTGLSVFLHTITESPARLFIFDSYFKSEETYFPVLQPGPNPAYLLSVDGTFSRFAIRADLLKHWLGVDERSSPCDWLRSSLKSFLSDNDRRAFAHCAAPVLEMQDMSARIAQMREEYIIECRRADEIRSPRSISVVICTKNNGNLLDQLLRQLLTDFRSRITDVIVVSNETTNAYALRALERWRTCSEVRVVSYDRPFNFSDQSNIGAKYAKGDLLLFLNDDVAPVGADWLDQLAEPFSDPQVGITGPLLLYPDETVQHAGMFLGYKGSAGHYVRRAALPGGDYCLLAAATRDVSCVTGAVLLIRRDIFVDLNGFDVQLRSLLQDTDLCLRVSALGYRVLFIGSSILFHMESISIAKLFATPEASEQRGLEHEYFQKQHGEIIHEDRFFNPCLHKQDESLRTLM